MSGSQKESYWSTYATVYDDGVDYVVGRALRMAVAEKLSHERNRGEVLECGCGTGFYTRVIAAHAQRVTATDVADEMLGVASHELASCKNVFFQKIEAEKISFPSKTFDTVLQANLVNTVKDPLKVLREGYRVLKSGGLLIVIVYTDYGMDGVEKSDLSLRYFQKFGMPPSWGLRNFSPEEFGTSSGRRDLPSRPSQCSEINPRPSICGRSRMSGSKAFISDIEYHTDTDLQFTYILRGRSFRTIDHIESDPISFGQRFKTLCLNG